MILRSYYQTVELFSFGIKTTLNNEFEQNFEWIYIFMDRKIKQTLGRKIFAICQ